MKHLIKLIIALSTLMVIANCSGSPRDNAMKEAKKNFDMAKEAKESGKRRAIRVYTNKGLLALSKYMNTLSEVDTVASNYWTKMNCELGLEVLKNYAQDEHPMEKINAFYDDMHSRLFIEKKDTSYVKNNKGKEIRKVKRVITKPHSPIAYRNFSTYLAAVADTLKSFEGIKSGFKYLSSAHKVDSLNPVVKKMFGTWKIELAKYNLGEAADFYASIKDEKEPNADDAIAAEYFTRVALKYDPKNEEALKMISVIREKMTNVYSAYVRVPDITGMSADDIDQDIDNNDVLIAFLDAKRSGNTFNCEISVYNNSYNAIEIRPNVFFVVDSEGKQYPVKENPKNEKQIPSKILDTEWEERGQLSFNVPAKKDIVKIIYHMERPDLANGGTEIHKAEKYLK